MHMFTVGARHGFEGAKPRKMSLSPLPTVKQTDQESGCQFITQFRILIVSVVKVCK